MNAICSINDIINSCMWIFHNIFAHNIFDFNIFVHIHQYVKYFNIVVVEKAFPSKI